MHLSVQLLNCCKKTTIASLIFSPPRSDSLQRRLKFCWHLFFFFFSLHNLRALSADRRKILHDARSCVQFYNPGPFTTFFKGESKIVLKCSVLAARTLTLLPGEFHLSKFPPIGLRALGGLTLGFAPNF